jgi:hypothetical protein
MIFKNSLRACVAAAAALRAPGVSVKEGCGCLQTDHQATLSRKSTLETLTNGAFHLF